jgi:hypothetical protein
MDKPIEVGKWAVIYKPTACCGKVGKNFGLPFVVTKISHMLGQCPLCGRVSAEVCVSGVGGRSDSASEAAICRRIDDPFEEEETLKDMIKDLEISLK